MLNLNILRYEIGLNDYFHSLDNMFNLNSGAYTPNVFSKFTFVTTSNTLKVEFISDIYNTYPTFSNIAVLVDNVYYRTISAIANKEILYSEIDLPLGTKRITLVTGLQSKPSTDLLGTWLRAVYVDADSLFSVENALTQNELLVYGDSIVAGGNCDIPPVQCFTQNLNTNYYGTILVEAHGFRSLNEDLLAYGDMTAFAQYLANADPKKLWIAIGTNDYGLSKWSASDFGVAYGNLLDAVNTLCPNCKIYCQSPLVRSDETANTFGDITQDYRDAISTVVVTRTDYATYIDGSTILTTSDLADGVHPTTLGHSKYSDYVTSVL